MGPEEGGECVCVTAAFHPGLTCEGGRLTLFPLPSSACCECGAVATGSQQNFSSPTYRRKKETKSLFSHALSRSTCASGFVLNFGVYEHSRSCWCFGHLLAFSTHPSWQNSLSSSLFLQVFSALLKSLLRLLFSPPPRILFFLVPGAGLRNVFRVPPSSRFPPATFSPKYTSS